MDKQTRIVSGGCGNSLAGRAILLAGTWLGRQLTAAARRIATIVLFLCAVVWAEAGSAKPNIIFVLADDWGIGDVKAYGGEMCKVETPNMDRLARDGMKFTDAHSSSSVCTPTRYSMLTGRYNWRSRLKSGVFQGYDRSLIDADRQTVSAFLKENGYETACIGKWHIGMEFSTTDGKPAQSKAKTSDEIATLCNVDWKGTIKGGPTSVGFDYFWGISASLDMPPYIWIENDHFVGECTEIKAFPRPGPAHADFEDIDVLPTLAKKATAYIAAESRKAKPFFLYLALNSPHTPISPSTRFQGKSSLGPYGDFVMETDWAVGEVVRAVEAAGLADNTLIIVTADNGCSPAATRNSNSHGLQFLTGQNEAINPDAHYPSSIYRGHKADIFEGGHRVPYIVRWDGRVKPGSVCSNTICLVDLFATCSDMLGVGISEDCAVDSVSILPYLTGSSHGPAREAVVHHSINGSFSIRQGVWKLCLCPGSGGWSYPTPEEFANVDVEQWIQLFDLSSDPAETRNLARAHPEIVQRLTDLMEHYIAAGRSTPGSDQSNDGETDLYPSWIEARRK